MDQLIAGKLKLVRDTEIPNYPFEYLYKVVIHHPDGNKFYVGKHKSPDGYIDYNYYGSASANEEQYLKDMDKYGGEFHIIETAPAGTKDMAIAEWKHLNYHNAKDNPSYYNQSNGGGHVKIKGKMKIQIILQKIKDRKYLTKWEDKDYLEEFLIRYQVREGKNIVNYSNPQQKKKIKKEFEAMGKEWQEKHGHPLVVIKDYYNKSNPHPGPFQYGHLLGDGNNTFDAACEVKTVTQLLTMWIPSEELKGLTKSEIKSLFRSLNEESREVPRLKPETQEIDNECINYVDDNNLSSKLIENKTEVIVALKEHLIEIWNMLPAAAGQYLKNFPEKYKQYKNELDKAWRYTDPTTGEDKNKLEKTYKNLKNNGYHATETISGSMPDKVIRTIYNICDEIVTGKLLDKNGKEFSQTNLCKVYFTIYRTGETGEKKWISKNRKTVESMMEFAKSLETNYNVRFEWDLYPYKVDADQTL
jgi:hypothetical protein